jgi:hypothetical protein
MSWKPEVIADNSGKWCGNALRFATRAEAESQVRDLFARWTAVRETRAVESSDPVNYRYVNGALLTLEQSEERAEREALASLSDLEQSRDARSNR